MTMAETQDMAKAEKTVLAPVTATPLRDVADAVLRGPAAALVVHAECSDEHEEPIVYILRRAA